MSYPKANNTVDNVVVAGNYILLIKRGKDPFKGMWALPGGFIEKDEDPIAASLRELIEETSIDITELQDTWSVGTFTTEDPRGWTLSTTYVHKVAKRCTVSGDDDADEADWFHINKLPELAFGHRKSIDAALALLDKITEIENDAAERYY